MELDKEALEAAGQTLCDQFKSRGLYNELDPDVQAGWRAYARNCIESFLASLAERGVRLMPDGSQEEDVEELANALTARGVPYGATEGDTLLTLYARRAFQWLRERAALPAKTEDEE